MRNREQGQVLATWAILALLLVSTRFGHFGHGLEWIDAAWAVFLLGGALLRGAPALLGLVALAGAVDVVASALGVSAECMSLGYLSLLPTYATLWWAGRLGGAGDMRKLPRIAMATVLGSVAAFAITNAGHFAFSPDVATMPLRTYVLAVFPYLPSYVVVALAYTLMGHVVVQTAAALRHIGRSQHDDA
jgi:hypothetical protein